MINESQEDLLAPEQEQLATQVSRLRTQLFEDSDFSLEDDPFAVNFVDQRKTKKERRFPRCCYNMANYGCCPF